MNSRISFGRGWAGHTALCDITHGPVRERPEWKAWQAQIRAPFETYHLNDQPADVRAAYDGLAPVVLAETETAMIPLLGAAELSECAGSVERFTSAPVAHADSPQHSGRADVTLGTMADVDPLGAFDRHFEWSNEVYRSIGRLIVEFGWLCEAMTEAVTVIFGDGTNPHGVPFDEDRYEIVMRNALGDAQPAELLKRFRAVVYTLHEHGGGVQPEDLPFVDNICVRIDRLIQERNTVTHGLWHVEPDQQPWNLNLPESPAVAATRRKFGRSGVIRRKEQKSPEELHQLADEAQYLRQLLGVIATLIHQPFLEDRLVWDENADVRFPVSGEG